MKTYLQLVGDHGLKFLLLGEKIWIVSKRLFGTIDDYNLQYKLSRSFHDLRNQFLDYYQIWFFEIKNEKEGELNDLILHLPFNGYYSITTDELDAHSAGIFSKQIKIGNLRPINRIRITVWEKYHIGSSFSSQEDYIKVSHTQGTCRVKFPVDATGFWAWIIKLSDHWILIVFILLFVIRFSLSMKKEVPDKK
ncbi:hypothetical protein K1X84_08965 [bacterium]|nr:hypothetical protein [bacterium]